MNSTLKQLINEVDQALPQTQCEQCGFKGCLPYATAIVQRYKPINRCPPGGDAVIRHLAQLLKRPLLELETSCGEHQAEHVVYIDESLCIGCTKCIQACPVDAIVGAKKLMHTIIEAECTGCDLCIPACPMDCMYIKTIENTVNLNDDINLNNDIDNYVDNYINSDIDSAINIIQNIDQIGLTTAQKSRAEGSRDRFNARNKRYEKLKRLTETVLPQQIELATHASSDAMLKMIAAAKDKAKNK
ncbi:hypothetical protein AwWohl_10370 [Gammaproteobacteria bacterium]|nr:hypothetical protein AwWohl_10370 [Gammaproteobacteria bacterium]